MRKKSEAAGEDGNISPRGAVPPAPTVPEWLAKLVTQSKQHGALQPEGEIVPTWTLVFALNDPEAFANRISEECRVILERVVVADLAMDVFFSRDEDEVFVKIGCAESILMDEATYANGDPMPLPLKLKFKNPQTGELDHRPNGRAMDGTYPFHEQLREHFVKAGERRFFHSGAQQVRFLSLFLSPFLAFSCFFFSLFFLAFARFCFSLFFAIFSLSFLTCFSLVLGQQRLVMHRFDRFCRITMEERLAMASREQLLKNAKRYLANSKGRYAGG